jgi:hypothetical protein
MKAAAPAARIKTAETIEMTRWELTHWEIVENMAGQSRAAPLLHHG